MVWGLIGILVMGLFVFLLVYPWRIHVRYGLEDGQTTEPLAVEVLGPVGLRFRVPVGSTTESRAAARDGAAQPATPVNDRGDDRHKTGLSGLIAAVQTVQRLVSSQQSGDLGQKGRRNPGRGDMSAVFLSFIRVCEHIYWRTCLGTGDAASTAWLVGTLWAVKGAAFSLLRQHVHFVSRPRFVVEPLWNKSAFVLHIDCIFRFRIGEIILAWVRKRLRAWQKGVSHFGHGKGPSH